MQLLRLLLKLRLKAARRQISGYARLRRPAGALKLHVGCGPNRFAGYVNIDINPSATVDYCCDASGLPCLAGSVDRIDWYHVIEHIPLPRVASTLQKFFEILKPGGILVTECPNFDEAVRQYMAGNKERLYSIYGRQRFIGDAHHWGYSPESLSSALHSIGFTNIAVLNAMDSHAANEPCMRVECIKPLQSTIGRHTLTT